MSKSDTEICVHRFLERCTLVLTDVAGVVLLALMMLTVLDVIMRYVFNAPVSGVWDITQFGMVLITFFGLAYCGFIGGHIVIDLIKGVTPRMQRLLDIVVNAISAIVMIVIAWRSLLYMIDVAETGAASMTLLLPFYPLLAVVAFGSTMFAVVLLARAIWPRETAASHIVHK